MIPHCKSSNQPSTLVIVTLNDLNFILENVVLADKTFYLDDLLDGGNVQRERDRCTHNGETGAIPREGIYFHWS